jgi:anti-sigma regulatory factor (Ser/Thr protein kinase)
MSEEARRSYENAIWLCDNDAKVIDDDELRFTKELLVGWRDHAEDLAAQELGKPQLEGLQRRLIVHSASLPSDLADLNGLHRAIEHFLLDVGASVAWANHYEDARLALYELALNAIRHGGASEVELDTSEGRVRLRDAGQHFGLQELLKNGRGGYTAVRALSERASGTLEVVYEWKDSRNEWSIIDHALDGGAANPCGLDIQQLGYLGAQKAVVDLPSLEGCDEIHVYPPRLWSYSDFFTLYQAIRVLLRERVLVVHGVDPSSGLGETIRRNVVTARLPDRGPRAFVKEW